MIRRLYPRETGKDHSQFHRHWPEIGVHFVRLFNDDRTGALMHLNRGRIWLGGLAGGVVWTIWSFLVGKYVITDARYVAAQNAGFFLKTPRYPFFVVQWIVLLFILAIAAAHLYGWARQTLGPGPGSRAEGRLSGRLLRRLPVELRAGYMVRRGPRASFWLDDRDVAGRHPGNAGRRLGVQRLRSGLADSKSAIDNDYFAGSTNTAVP